MVSSLQLDNLFVVIFDGLAVSEDLGDLVLGHSEALA